MKKNIILFLMCAIVWQGFSQTKQNLAKFEPEDGKCLVFVGQDLGAIGGLDAYNEGYVDRFQMPAGITTYTNINPGFTIYNWNLKGNDGITELANWGSGDVCAQMQIDDQDFKNCILAIGLAIINNEVNIKEGKRDSLIIALGNWIKSLGNRPVFLRIGFEFDGHPWNHYDREPYLDAWRHIHKTYSKMGINNIAYVWQSKGFGTSMEEMEDWYPGDEYVDWCSYSYLIKPDMEMIKFARKHNKPVFIAEATPVIFKNDTIQEIKLANTEQAKEAWNDWFIGFFNTIEDNSDVIKAFSYINVDWTSQDMWKDTPPFKYINSRIQLSEEISKKWSEELQKEKYIHAYEGLWEYLWHAE